MFLTASGFLNGIIAYGVAFIQGGLASWRVLFLIEGSSTILIAIVALILLPEDIAGCFWLKDDEKDFRELALLYLCMLMSVLYQRYISMGAETKAINWKHARGALYRWQQVFRESKP